MGHNNIKSRHMSCNLFPKPVLCSSKRKTLIPCFTCVGYLKKYQELILRDKSINQSRISSNDELTRSNDFRRGNAVRRRNDLSYSYELKKSNFKSSNTVRSRNELSYS